MTSCSLSGLVTKARTGWWAAQGDKLFFRLKPDLHVGFLWLGIADPRKNGVLIPAINELRYYSYHLVKALNTECAQTQFEEFSRAQRHCLRASYDALELGLTTVLDDIIDKTNHYSKRLVIGEVIHNYTAKLTKAHEAQDLLGSSYKDKEAHFEKISECLKELVVFNRELKVSEDEFRTKIRLSKKPLYIAVIAAFFSGVIATTNVLNYSTNSEPASSKLESEASRSV